MSKRRVAKGEVCEREIEGPSTKEMKEVVMEWIERGRKIDRRGW